MASLARGFAVLEAFRGRRRMTLTELAASANLNKAATRRLLLTLQAIGVVASEGRYFFLTPRILSLALGYIASLDFWEAAQPVLEELSRELGETCAMAVLDGRDIVFVARSFPRRRLLSVDVSVGTRLPAHATAIGQVLLAYLPPARLDAILTEMSMRAVTRQTLTTRRALELRLLAVRHEGHAIARGELDEALTSVAVPILDREGQAMAALNVVMEQSKADEVLIRERILPLLARAASRIIR